MITRTPEPKRKVARLTPPAANLSLPPSSFHSHPMTFRFAARVLSLPMFLLPALLRAADAPAVSGWHAQTLGQAIGYMLLFSGIGILVAIGGYKLFDKCTPGDLHHEIVQNKNVAAAIVAGSVILGVCLIIAASMLG